MEGAITKIAVLAPFAAGIGRKPGLFARVAEELAPALEIFGRDCVLEVERTLVAEGRVAVPLVPPDGLSAAAWFPQIYPGLQCNAEAEKVQTTAVQAGSRPASGSQIDALLDMVALPEESLHPAGESLQAHQSSETALLNHILRHPDFQARCAAWQGLSWINALADDTIQWLLVDIDPAAYPDEVRQIETLLLDEEPELLLVDLPLTNTPRDQETLAVLAGIGDQLLAPVLSWLDSPFWGLTSWQRLHRLPYLPNLLDQPQYGKWRSLCHRDEAHQLCTAVGRFALLEEQEPSSLPPHTQEPLWLAPIWILAALILRQQRETGLPYPLAGTRLSPPAGTSFTLEATFSDDRCFQFLQAHQAPLIGTGKEITFAGLPLTDGSSLDLQLLIRSLLGWLFSLDPTQYDADTLQVTLFSLWKGAGIQPPAAIDFALDQGHLFLSIQPPAGMALTGGEITLQLPWGRAKLSETSNGA